MNKVFIFIIYLLLVSICSEAAEETLEERKRRIMRKYAPLKTTITQSNMEVVGAFSEDESVIASEIMQVEDLQFEREDPNRMIRPPAVRPNPQQSQSNWLLPSEDLELEDNINLQKSWSMYGASDDKSARKATSKDINYLREQSSQKDIFGFRAPEKRLSDGRGSSRGSDIGGQEMSRAQWGAPLDQNSILEQSAYKSSSILERKSQYDRNEKDPRIQSIDRTPTTDSFKRPAIVKPLPESATFSRPQADFTPRVQIRRNNLSNGNRDLERLIEQNKR